jgi:hypothetical protein
MNVIDGADLETVGLVGNIGFPRQENNGDVARLRVRFQVLASFITVHVGHDHVKQNEAGRWLYVRKFQRLNSILCHTDFVLFAQYRIHDFDIFRVVVH